jgi:hypothetical protein
MEPTEPTHNCPANALLDAPLTSYKRGLQQKRHTAMVLSGVWQEVEHWRAWQEASGCGSQEFYGAVLGYEGEEEIWGCYWRSDD